MKRFQILLIVVTFWLLSPILSSMAEENRGQPWKRHTIDNTSRGADGIDLADVNGDGLQDLVSGWEEGGEIRLYLNPGPKQSVNPWPKVTVGKVRSPEDAKFMDVDGNGVLDIVSSCEGREQTIFVHWSPVSKAERTHDEKWLQSSTWKTEPLPASEKKQLWMFSRSADLDGDGKLDLIAGSKGKNASIGWFEAPPNPRDLAKWKWHPLYDAGWIMSLKLIDINRDGEIDIVSSDRKGKQRGCWWLENPGVSSIKQNRPGQQSYWKLHSIGGQNQEVMFMSEADLNDDRKQDFLVAVSGGDILYLKNESSTEKNPTQSWSAHAIKMPENVGRGKAVASADLDLDGREDVILTCEHSERKSGVVWLSRSKSQPATDPNWETHEISGPEKGVKFDLIQLLDLDADGDLDILTCEERHNLGVIWYENPTK